MSGARYLPTRSALSPKQRAMLESVLSAHERIALGLADDLPCILDLVREEHDGPGHDAGYQRAWRLIKRGYLRATRIGSRLELEITDKGRMKLGVMA